MKDGKQLKLIREESINDKGDRDIIETLDDGTGLKRKTYTEKTGFGQKFKI